MEVRKIICDGPMCDKEVSATQFLPHEWYTLRRDELHDAHFCCLNCIWQWSKEIVNDPSGGMGPYYAKYKKVSKP